MPRRSGLGRGLEALIPPEPASVAGSDGNPPDSVDRSGAPALSDGASLREIAVSAIHPNRFQPRHEFVDDDMADLTASIRSLGVLQPLLVREDPAGGFELIAGERRWRAAQEAGLDRVPAVVRQVADRDALEQALVENLQRSDLNAMEEAAAYLQLVDAFELTQDAVASRVGRSRSTVANTLRLLQLAAPVQQLVRDGVLSAGHARALLGIDDPDRQALLAGKAVREGWSVRQVEAEVKDAGGADPSKAKPPKAAPPASAGVLELEDLLGSCLDTRVRVVMAGGGARDVKGKVVIEFAGFDDLERVFRRINDGPATAEPV